MKLILISILFTLTLSVLDQMWRYPRNYKYCYEKYSLGEIPFVVDKNGKGFVVFDKKTLKMYFKEHVDTRYDYVDNMTFLYGQRAYFDADLMARCRHERNMEYIYNTCVNDEIEKVCDLDRDYHCLDNVISIKESEEIFKKCDHFKRNSGKEALDNRINKFGIYDKAMKCIKGGNVRKRCIAKYINLHPHPFKVYYDIISVLVKIINPDCTEKYYWDCLEDKREAYWIWVNPRN